MPKFSRLVVCALFFSLSTLASREAAAQSPQPSTGRGHVLIRSGSAAAPFGAATTIADFDSDGAPDVAIADRLNRGSAYTIEFHLSHGSPQTVAFFSTTGPLDIHALDIDDDHDADLIVTPVLSREVIGIWVNDGGGHFAAGELAAFRSVAPRLTSAASLSGGLLDAVPIVSDRRLHLFNVAAGPSVFHQTVGSASLPSFDSPVATRPLSGNSPRAPPSRG